MATLVNCRRHGAVEILNISHGRDNAVSRLLCTELTAALQAAIAEPEVAVILLSASGEHFSRGIDLNWLDEDPSRQALLDLCDQIEHSPKPVIAALHGDVLGAGFELALAAHYRLAAPDLRIGFPGITIGLPPICGGTQRLPRLIGAEATLHLMLSGRAVSGAALGPVFDAEITGDFASGAERFAVSLAEQDTTPLPSADRREGFADPFAYQDAVANLKTMAQSKGQAGLDILRCVEAAPLLPFEAGLDLEHEAFNACLRRDRPAALRHVLIAERHLAHVGEQLAQNYAKLGHVAILGETAVGIGLAADCLLHAITVTFVSPATTDIADTHDKIQMVLEQEFQRRRITDVEIEDLIDNLEVSRDVADCAGADLVIETTYGNRDAKLKMFSELGHILPGHAVLASTSTLVDLAECAEAAGRAQQVIGLHIPSPAQVKPAVELVAGAEASSFAVAAGSRFAGQLGKTVIPVRNCPGLAAGTILVALWQMADQLLREGADFAAIDAAMRDYGFPMGPFQALDLRGIPAALALALRVTDGSDPQLPVLTSLSEAGFLGKDSGAGFYNYEPGQRSRPANGMAIEAIAALRDAGARDVPDVEIQLRLAAAMANAGAKLVRDKVVERPADIDVLMIKGYGFPRHRGGPLKAADLTGLLSLRNVLNGQTDLLVPDPLLLDLIKNGKQFASLNDVVS